MSLSRSFFPVSGRTLSLIVRVPFLDHRVLEFAATVGAEEELKDVKIILTAERITRDERRLLTQMGAWRVMLKPVAPEEMEHAIRTAAEEAQAAHTAR